MNHLAELEAMRSMYEILQKIEGGHEAHVRVLGWLSESFGVQPPSAAEKQRVEDKPDVTWSTFADLYHGASPNSNQEKALAAGYWLQSCKGQDDFDASSVNKELHNLGHGLGNVTDAFNQLKGKKLALQVGKSGKSQQARKRYKLTQAGIKAVEEMIRTGMA
jgi:hypothetical protein